MAAANIDLSRASKPGKLLVVSILVLFVELALIRYLGSEIPAVGFFKNLILIASFIGLGIGLMQSLAVKPTFLLLALSLLFPLGLVAVSSVTGLDQGAYTGLEEEAVLVSGGLAVFGIALVVLAFLSTMMPMIFLGRLMGHYFDAFEQPLTAYAWNILGSLVGTILFSVLCFLSTPPVVWFSVSVGLFMVLVLAEWKYLGLKVTVPVCMLALLALPLLSAISESGELWTPYYKVQVYPMTYDTGEQTGFGLNVNNTWFQRSFDMRYLSRDEELDEESRAGFGFLTVVTQKIEDFSREFETLGLRSVVIRTGVVLGSSGGALPKMIMPFKFYLGGHWGSGRQWMSWISLADEVAAIKFLIENSNLYGAFNLTCPEPMINRNFFKVLAGELRKPCCLPIPALALKIMFGEMADELFLAGQKVYPRKLINAGFKFKYSELQKALESMEIGRRNHESI